MVEPHRLVVRVYYEDTDFSGVVYHANYLRFLERARTEFLRDLGVAQRELRDEAGRPLAFAVRRMAIDFLKPARMDDLMTIETAVAAVTGASLDLDQVIQRDGEILTRVAVKVVLIGGGRPRRLPADLVSRIGHWARRPVVREPLAKPGEQTGAVSAADRATPPGSPARPVSCP